jgi:hypothetical protein
METEGSERSKPQILLDRNASQYLELGFWHIAVWLYV